MSWIDRIASRMGYMRKIDASPAYPLIQKQSAVSGMVEYEREIDHYVTADGKEVRRKDAGHYFRTNPWVYSAVNTICKNVSHVKFKVMRGETEVTDAAIMAWMEQPAPGVSLQAMIESIMQNLELYGAAYVEWVIDADGKQAYVLHSSRMMPEMTAKVMRRYKYSVNGKSHIFQPDELVIGKYQSPCDDLNGLSPLEVCIETLETWEAAEKYNRNFLFNGGRPSGVFIPDEPLGENEVKQATAEIRRVIRGEKNAGTYAVLPNKFIFQELSQTPKDMDHLNLLKWCRESMLAALNMPPVEVGVFEYANYANSVVQKRIFWEECIIPRLTVLRDILSATVQRLFGDGLMVVEDLSGIRALQENAAEVATADNIQIANGTLTVNESRLKHGRDPVDGGDVALIGGGLVPLADAVMPVENTPQDLNVADVGQFTQKK